jgi:hypothetical protein
MPKSPTKKFYASMRVRFRLSSHARPVALRSLHSLEINRALRSLVAMSTIGAALLVPLATPAATPTPRPATSRRPVRVDLTKIQPKALLPKHDEHTEFLVDVNRLGQVTRVIRQRASDNAIFNTQTYGNALQTFIRTPDGHVILGQYRLTYDFDPKTARVRRDVSLVRQGGVDPNAKGAAAAMFEQGRKHPISPNFSPRPGSSVDPRMLPELPSVIAPTQAPSP